MRKVIFIGFILLISSFVVLAQTPSPSPAGVVDAGIKPNLAMGEVMAVNSTDNKISLQTKDGNIDVVLSAATAFKRIPADNPKLSAAVDSSLSDLGVGDKVLVTGNVSADKKTIPAKSVYLMTKADISKKNATEKEMWRTRGISGRVISLNPNTQEFTLAVRGMMGEQNVVVSPKGGINYKRYAPNSQKFDDAKDSSFTELKVGDQVRALGDKSADNANFKAERVVSGAFKMVGGTITAIDVAKNEITIKELQTNKPITIVVNSNSLMKKFPVEMATMLAGRMTGGTTAVQPTPGGAGGGHGNVVMTRPPQGAQTTHGQTAQTTPNGTNPPPGATTTFRPGAGGRGEFDDLLERFPVISLSDLKVGDAIAISSSASADNSRYTAIKLVSGVEPFFKAPQMAAGGGNRGGGSQAAGLNIPGLDGGIGAP